MACARQGARWRGACLRLPEADYAKALQGFGLPEGFAAVVADRDAKVANGALLDDSPTFSRLIGRPMIPAR